MAACFVPSIAAALKCLCCARSVKSGFQVATKQVVIPLDSTAARVHETQSVHLLTFSACVSVTAKFRDYIIFWCRSEAGCGVVRTTELHAVVQKETCWNPACTHYISSNPGIPP